MRAKGRVFHTRSGIASLWSLLWEFSGDTYFPWDPP